MSDTTGITRAIGDLIAWFAFLVAATGLAARYSPVINHAVLVVAALSPYLIVAGASVATALALLNHRWWAVVASIALLVAAISLQAPRFIDSGRGDGHDVSIRVMTANLLMGEADPDAIASLAKSSADLLIVEELTTGCAAALQQRLNSDFSYQAVDAADYGRGVGIWSRHPLTGAHRIPGYELGVVSANVRVPGATSDAVVLATHLVGPWPQPIDDWRKEIAAFPSTLRRMADAAGDGAVIVAGDFNATTDMQPFRRLLDHGYRDAAAQSGAGLIRTFPSNSSVPPLIGIDHILLRNSSASDVHTVPIPGTDHLGVAATVHLPGVAPEG